MNDIEILRAEIEDLKANLINMEKEKYRVEDRLREYAMDIEDLLQRVQKEI